MKINRLAFRMVLAVFAVTLGVSMRRSSAETLLQRGAPEKLIVVPVLVMRDGEKHGNLRVKVILKVTGIVRSKSKLRVGQRLYLETLHSENLPHPWPLPLLEKGANYRAYLVRQKPPRPGSATSVRGALIYKPAAEVASFERVR